MIELFFNIKNIDIIIAGILFVAGILIFFASRMGVLPKKTIPFVVAGLVGAFSVTLLQAIFKKHILRELDKRKEELDRRMTELENRSKDLDKRKGELEEERLGLRTRLDEADKQDARLAEIEAAREEAWMKVKEVKQQLERQKTAYLETIAALDKEAKQKIDETRKANENMSAGELLDAVTGN